MKAVPEKEHGAKGKKNLKKNDQGLADFVKPHV